MASIGFSDNNEMDNKDEIMDTAQVTDEAVAQAKSDAIAKIEEQVKKYEKDPAKMSRDEESIKKNLWTYVANVGKKVGKGILDSVKFLWDAMTDPRTPFEVKIIAIAALVYFISPIDFIPDVLPVIGFTDDTAALAAAVASISIILLKHGINLKEEASESK